MSRAVKRVLIEQAELDRITQRQLLDYSPELHSMAALYQERIDVLARKGLSNGEKLQLLSSIDRRFDQLKRETNTLSSKVALKVSDGGDEEAAVPAAVEADNEEPVQDEAAAHEDQAPVVAPKTPAGPLNLRTINVHP